MLRPVRRQVLIAALTIVAVVAVVSLTGSPRTSADVPAAGGSYIEGVVGHPAYLNPLLSTLNDADEEPVARRPSFLFHACPFPSANPPCPGGHPGLRS